jgi:DNA-binding CsgD family transcriptional regulator
MTLPPRLTIPLAEWIDTAAPGDSVIVQTSPHNGNREVADARDAGLITTAQKRAGGAFHHIAVRTTVAPPKDIPEPRKIVAHRAPRATPEIMQDRMARIVALTGEGVSLEDIAKRLGVSRPTVSRYTAEARKQGLMAQDKGPNREAAE